MPGYLLSNPTILGLQTTPTSCLHFPRQSNAGTGARAVLRVADRGRAVTASAIDFKEGNYHLYVLHMRWVWHSQVRNIDSFKIAFWLLPCIISMWCASSLDHLGDCFSCPHVLTKWEICVFYCPRASAVCGASYRTSPKSPRPDGSSSRTELLCDLLLLCVLTLAWEVRRKREEKSAMIRKGSSQTKLVKSFS